ncbi:MAG: hypothetical protein GY716_02330 [bacterium]|nr:hypothetical protein [bacterium]
MILVTTCTAAAVKGLKGLAALVVFWAAWTILMVFMPWLVVVQLVMIAISTVVALPIALIHEGVASVARRTTSGRPNGDALSMSRRRNATDSAPHPQGPVLPYHPRPYGRTVMTITHGGRQVALDDGSTWRIAARYRTPETRDRLLYNELFLEWSHSDDGKHHYKMTYGASEGIEVVFLGSNRREISPRYVLPCVTRTARGQSPLPTLESNGPTRALATPPPNDAECEAFYRINRWTYVANLLAAGHELTNAGERVADDYQRSKTNGTYGVIAMQATIYSTSHPDVAEVVQSLVQTPLFGFEQRTDADSIYSSKFSGLCRSD